MTKIPVRTISRETMTRNLAVSSIHSQPFRSLNLTWILDSNSKKSCQGCELPSDDVPDSTSNSRGQNNNTPSATNNNQSNPIERTNGAISRATPNSTIEMGAVPNGPGVISNADSSVASTVSLEEEEESPVKIKKKEENHSRKVSWSSEPCRLWQGNSLLFGDIWKRFLDALRSLGAVQRSHDFLWSVPLPHLVDFSFKNHHKTFALPFPAAAKL